MNTFTVEDVTFYFQKYNDQLHIQVTDRSMSNVYALTINNDTLCQHMNKNVDIFEQLLINGLNCEKQSEFNISLEADYIDKPRHTFDIILKSETELIVEEIKVSVPFSHKVSNVTICREPDTLPDLDYSGPDMYTDPDITSDVEDVVDPDIDEDEEIYPDIEEEVDPDVEVFFDKTKKQTGNFIFEKNMHSAAECLERDIDCMHGQTDQHVGIDKLIPQLMSRVSTLENTVRQFVAHINVCNKCVQRPNIIN